MVGDAMTELLAHRYGPSIHVFDDAFLSTLLCRISSPDTGTAEVPNLVGAAYQQMVRAVLAREFPRQHRRAPTRMTAQDPQAAVVGDFLCRETKLVICAVIRAGILPAQTCYEAAIQVLPPENVRLDFLTMSRITDAQHHVIGVRLDGSKIGGPVDDAVVLIPDPMGATGGTVCRAVEVYRALGRSAPRRIVAAHLMATPEACRRLASQMPDVQVYTGRLDRGLSTPRALAAVPGEFPDEERGLNDVQYIVPGAGGMGELLTNSWV